MNALLFASTVLIWGTTWIAIAFEIGPVPILVSVFYRFASAAAVMILAMALLGRLPVPARRHQPFVVAQALCLYCCNFICFYAAAGFIPSGLVSVVFSLATLLNALNARLFFAAPVTGRTAGAAAMGVAGLAMMLGPDLAVGADAGTAKGVGLALLGTLFFSLGNMASRRNSAAGVPPAVANAWGMLYGAGALLALVALTRTPVVAPPGGAYLLALAYLSIVGSVIGFTAYLSLVARIGSSRAAYATVLFPVVALAISTVFEGYRWHPLGVVGLAVALGGNVLIFTGPGAAPAARPARGALAS